MTVSSFTATLSRPAPILALAALAAAATPLHTAAQAADGVPPAQSSVMVTLGADMGTIEQKLVGLAETIPEASYDWRPGDGVRSVAEVFLHVAADNYFIPLAVGFDAPVETGILKGDYASVQAYEAQELTKEEIVAELAASFAHARAVMAEFDAAGLAQEYHLYGRTFTGEALWILNTGHLHEHVGQAIAYTRTIGEVPPWSR